MGLIAKRSIRGRLNLAVCFTSFLSTHSFQERLHKSVEMFAVIDSFSSHLFLMCICVSATALSVLMMSK